MVSKGFIFWLVYNQKRLKLKGFKSLSHFKQFFLVKLTWNTLSAPGWNKEEIKNKRILQEAIVTAGYPCQFYEQKLLMVTF